MTGGEKQRPAETQEVSKGQQKQLGRDPPAGTQVHVSKGAEQPQRPQPRGTECRAAGRFLEMRAQLWVRPGEESQGQTQTHHH